jgi:hypothetical protein
MNDIDISVVTKYLPERLESLIKLKNREVCLQLTGNVGVLVPVFESRWRG